MPCFSPLKGFKSRHNGGLTYRRDDGYEKMEVGCGYCLGCRVDYRRMWAMRIAHEASLYEYNGGNSFITLTYRDKLGCSVEQLKNEWHVPNDWSLHPEHVTKFLKRLRKHFNDVRVRYYYVGEYGRKCQHGIELERVGCPLCVVGRPHYHMCLFGLSFDDLIPYESDGGIVRYTSPCVEKLWKYGFVDVGELNYSSAAYCAGYMLKKIRKKDDHKWHYCQYSVDGEVTYLTPEFARMSRGGTTGKGKNCGIGAGWFEKFKDDVFPSDEVPVPGLGVVKGVPRYYEEIYKSEHPEDMERVKEERVKFLKKHAEDYTPRRLEDKYKCRKAKDDLKESRYL